MADRIKIGEVDIDLEMATRQIVELKKQAGATKAQLAEMKKEGKENTDEYVKLSAELKSTTTNLRTHENILAKTIESTDAEKGSLDQLKAQLAVVSREWSKLSEEERVNTKRGQDLTKQKTELTNKLKAEEAATGDARRNVGNYQSALQGLPGPQAQVIAGIQGINMAFKALLANPIVLLIAAIITVLVGLFKAIKSTDNGATELAARMEQLRAILDVVRQRAIALVGAFKELFSGNFKQAAQEFKEAFTGIGEQIGEATRAAYAYKQALDTLENSEQNFISRSAEIQNAIARLEYTAQDRSRSTAERKKALEEAVALAEQELEQEKAYAKERLDLEATYLAEKNGLRAEDIIAFTKMTDEEQANASEALKDLRNANEEKLVEIEKLYAEWINLDTKFYQEQKRNVSKLSAFNLQLQKDEADARAEQAAREADAAVQRMREETAEFIAQQTARKEIQAQVEGEMSDLSDEYRARQAEARMIDLENETALLQQTYFGQLDLQRQKLEQQKAMEIANAEKVGADILLIEKKYAKAEAQIERTKRDAKLSLAAGAAKDLAAIFGETTAAGKAAAAAMTTIETWRAAQAAATGMIETIPGPVGIALGIVAAAAQVALGLSRVKKILSVPTNGTGAAPSGGGETSSAASSTTLASNMINTQTSVGNGIVSRETVAGTQAPGRGQSVLVIDDVTAAQKAEADKVVTSTF